MGVFKWLRRERVTLTSHRNVSPDTAVPEVVKSQSVTLGTIRTEEYKRDLAEFQARRSADSKELELLARQSSNPQVSPETPVKKKCGRHSLPVTCSCADFTSDHDNTFNYEKKSAVKYKKHKRVRSTTPDKLYERVPNIQFLFQNQVFMPGGKMFTSSYSEPQKSKLHLHRSNRSSDFTVSRHIDFKDNDLLEPPPEFYKGNYRPFDSIDEFRSDENAREEVDGLKAAGDVNNCKEEGDVKLWEVMSELQHLDQWADEQLLSKSPITSRSDDTKSDTSAYGLPIASARSLDINSERPESKAVWKQGRWGVIPVQVKRLADVTVEHVRKKRSAEINILRKCRHPNIILLMGIYPDAKNNVHIICERCVDTLYGVLHIQGGILSAQTAIQYSLDIANALVFLQMQGYIHTELNSQAIMITNHDAAKLADLGPCSKINKFKKGLKGIEKDYEIYSPEPQYVNIEGTSDGKSSDNEPLLSTHSSETYLKSYAAAKPYEKYHASEMYRWQAPELFTPNEEAMVHPCSKSDVYSLCMVLWESCNACIPWKSLPYTKLQEQYITWRSGIPLPQDGTYPGCLLAILQGGLSLDREARPDLRSLQASLFNAKRDLDELGYTIIPARLQTKKLNFSSVAWDSSPTDSEEHSPHNHHLKHRADVHAKEPDSTTDSSDKDCSKSDNPVYETIRKSYTNTSYCVAQKCFIRDDDEVSLTKYDMLPENSSACSTPIAKIRARIKDIDTPGALHRSDSTEYCSILSPNRTNYLPYDDSGKDQSSVERSTAKLSRSFTPKSYKPLHIKVPEFNLDSIKPLLKEQNGTEKSSYSFDIKNYSLPNTPIARSNKLRKNAWLSGDVANDKTMAERPRVVNGNNISKTSSNEDAQPKRRPPESPETIPKSTSTSPEIHNISSENKHHFSSNDNSSSQVRSVEPSPASVGAVRESAVGPKSVSSRNQPPKWLQLDVTQVRPSFPPSPLDGSPTNKIDEELLASMQVKPLVAIHERWIYEANKKAGRSLSLPEENSFKTQISALKPASHCVDTLQKSLPQLNTKKSTKTFRVATSPNSHGGNWEQFCQARDSIARGVNFSNRSPDRYQTWTKHDKGNSTEEMREPKIDQCTDTNGIENFIRDLIRKEFQHLLHEMSDDTSSRNEDLVNKGVSNIIETLNTNDGEKSTKKDAKSFSRVKISGNNKPLLQITFNRSGENSLQVLDNCVNVTICDNPGRDKLNVSLEDTLTEDDKVGGLKRCQAFSAIQEARSTEDLYIDDDLSTQLHDEFGGRIQLIPLHGSLHEILCEKQDECCLIKVKQEHGCDTVYFRCTNSDTDSRDAIDGCEDTVVFKRSISLVEQRIKRVPKERVRPKSEIFPTLDREKRALSNSSPALNQHVPEIEAPELNIESAMCYQDSSSDECLLCRNEGDEFELLEKKIELDMAASRALTCALGKISEENLSSFNEDSEKEIGNT